MQGPVLLTSLCQSTCAVAASSDASIEAYYYMIDYKLGQKKLIPSITILMNRKELIAMIHYDMDGECEESEITSALAKCPNIPVANEATLVAAVQLHPSKLPRSVRVQKVIVPLVLEEVQTPVRTQFGEWGKDISQDNLFTQSIDLEEDYHPENL